MQAKRPCDGASDNHTTGPSRQTKQHHHRAHQDRKYDAIFDLLKRAEECGERMEICVEEGKSKAFEQAQKALDAYIMLSDTGGEDPWKWVGTCQEHSLKGQEPFTCHVSAQHISGTCVMSLAHVPYMGPPTPGQ